MLCFVFVTCMLKYIVVYSDLFFQIGKGKEGCGRVVVRKQLGIVNAYTMEASFMGADQVSTEQQFLVDFNYFNTSSTPAPKICIPA